MTVPDNDEALRIAYEATDNMDVEQLRMLIINNYLEEEKSLQEVSSD